MPPPYSNPSGLSTGRAAALLILCALLAGGLVTAWVLTDTQSSETMHDARGKPLVIHPGQSIGFEGDDDAPRKPYAEEPMYIPSRSTEKLPPLSHPREKPAATQPASRPTTAPLEAPRPSPANDVPTTTAP